jgi:predicted membrane channel-forming protein YqfA (hemolysin III family)
MSGKYMSFKYLDAQGIEMRSFREPVLYTNLLFLVNSAFWAIAGHPVIALIVLVTGLASFSYHIPKESVKLTHDFDVCCAHVALFSTLYVIYPYASLFQWSLLIGVLSAGLYTKRLAQQQNYDYWHTVWHIFVFLGQALMASIAYV